MIYAAAYLWSSIFLGGFVVLGVLLVVLLAVSIGRVLAAGVRENIEYWRSTADRASAHRSR